MPLPSACMWALSVGSGIGREDDRRWEESEICTQLQGYSLSGITRRWLRPQQCGGWIRALQEEPAEWQVGRLPFMWESSGSTWRLTVGQVRSQLGAYGSGLAGRPTWDVSGVSAASHLVRKKVRSPSGTWKEPQIHRTWSPWGTLPTLLPAGGVAQQGTKGPECFWCVLLTTSWPRWLRSWQKEALLRDFRATTKKVFARDARVGAALPAGTMRWLNERSWKEWVGQKAGSQTWTSGDSDLFRDQLWRIPWDIVLERRGSRRAGYF